MKACSFFGHRDFEPTIEIEEKVYAIIENLIVENLSVGTVSNTSCAICYIKNIAPDTLYVKCFYKIISYIS